MIRHPLYWVIGFMPALVLLGVLLAGEKEAAKKDPSIRFSEHLIADQYGYAYGLAAADLDGDGDLDLTSQDIRGQGKRSQSSLFWFENDGKGTFKRYVIHEGEPGWFERHAIGDISGDGKPDVAVVNNRDGYILWFENNGTPPVPPLKRGGKGGWKRYVITTKSPRVYDVVLADLDGDGDLDAADAGYANSQISWYENPGPEGWHREWVRLLVGDKMPEARTIHAGDFNGDGKVDLLGAAVGAENTPLDADQGGRVVWYENPGTPPCPPLAKGE